MDLGLKNKNALITGGSQGIGPAIARGKTVEEVLGALPGISMVNRLGRPEEMGWIAAVLVSYMTGITVEPSGGATKYI